MFVDGRLQSAISVPCDAWDYDDVHDVVALKVFGEDVVSLFDGHGAALTRFGSAAEAKHLRFSECGTILTVTGEETEVCRLTWAPSMPVGQAPEVAIPRGQTECGEPIWSLRLRHEDVGSPNQILISTDGSSVVAVYHERLERFHHGKLTASIPPPQLDREFSEAAVSSDGMRILAGLTSDRVVGTHFACFDSQGNVCWSANSADQEPWIENANGAFRKTRDEIVDHAFFLPDGEIVFRTRSHAACVERRNSSGAISRRFSNRAEALIQYRRITSAGVLTHGPEAETLWYAEYLQRHGIYTHPKTLDSHSYASRYTWNGLDISIDAEGCKITDQSNRVVYRSASSWFTEPIPSASGKRLALTTRKETLILDHTATEVGRHSLPHVDLLNVSDDGAIVFINPKGEIWRKELDRTPDQVQSLGVLPPKSKPVISRYGLSAFVAPMRENPWVVVLDDAGRLKLKWRCPMPYIEVRWADEASVCAAIDSSGYIALFAF